MSLVTDKFFAKALSSDEDVQAAVEGRIFNTVDDEIDPDSAAIPSIFIINNGTQNDQGTKDESYESETDRDNIMLGISARTREELGNIATLVRKVIKETALDTTSSEWEDLGFILEDYNFTASSVTWDAMKPCYWQELNYQCETTNL